MERSVELVTGSRAMGQTTRSTSDDERRRGASRRVFLKATATAGALAGVSGVTIGQDDGNETDDDTGDESGGESQAVISDGPTIGLELVGEGFTSPVGFEVAPGDEDRYFVVDQLGQIYVLEGGSNGDGGPLQ